MSVRVDVPGKLVLVGEYAVLDGAPALAMAVTDGVSCARDPAERLEIHTPDGDDRFARAALSALGSPPGRYRFTTRTSLDLPGKPGFGGSAAATVAALLAGGFRGGPDALAALAQRVHREVQGSGSGIDVQVAARGGFLRVEGDAARPTDLPAPVVVYSGQSARTGPRVAAYLAWAGREAFARESRTWVEAFPSDPAGVAREAWRGLCAMAEQARIAYRTPGLDRICALAEAAGGGAKPSGAGGGDCAVAWVPDPPAFRAAVAREGFAVLPVGVGGPPRVFADPSAPGY